MGFKASQLLPALKIAFKVISKKNTLPVLDCFLLSEGAFGGTVVTSSDLENTISIETDVVIDALPLCVSAELFLKTIEGIGDADVELTNNNVSVVVKSATAEFTMPAMDHSDFPTLPKAVVSGSITVDAADLMHHLNLASKFAANDELRPVMNGVCVNGGDIVATDAHTLYAGVTDNDFKTPFIVHPKSIGVLNALVTASNLPTISVNVSDRNIIFVCGSHVLISRMIEGKYPNYNSVIPRNSSIAVAVNRTAFEKALKRVKVFSNKTSNFIRLDIAVDSMTISSQDLDFSISAHEVISSTSNEE